MKSCSQTDTQSVYDHGLSVKDYTFDLLQHLRLNTPLKFNWKLPDWVTNHKEYLLKNIYSDEIIHQYTTLHDCGKPFCLTYDEKGRRHFPDHAKVSSQVYQQVINNPSPIVSRLIRKDMDFHVLKAKDLPDFSNSLDAMTLIVVGLAEIHSNADMFGGLESTSFKIKWKHVNKKGRQIIEHQQQSQPQPKLSNKNEK